MPEYGFGQPHGSIIQTAFVVPDIHEAVRLWTRDLREGLGQMSAMSREGAAKKERWTSRAAASRA